MAIELERLDDQRWRIPKTGKMRVEGRLYASEALIEAMRDDACLEQVRNVACLPGIVRHSIAMPDAHWGYGFPIGGVAAFDLDEGVLSPGGVGYDINCGVRLLRSRLTRDAIAPRLRALTDVLFQKVPSGVGSQRSDRRLSSRELRRVLADGAAWAVDDGQGEPHDLRNIEQGGAIPTADPERVGERALARGASQLGTLGSGNHFCEIGYVSDVYDRVAAEALGLEVGGITVCIHTGSRGLGYQVCDDSLKTMVRSSARHGIELPDRQLCAAPLGSPEADAYLGAMGAAANFAFANRQCITGAVRASFEEALALGPHEHGIEVVYDVAHNMAKIEEHEVDGESRQLCVHRKGATRAFPPGHPELPAAYSEVGQPVLIPGDMGTCSYVLVGTQKAFTETFGSTCHGAGRQMSRTQARRRSQGRPIVRELEERGIFVRSAGRRTLLEEVPEAYKDVSEVCDVVDAAGIARKVARLVPLGVVKG